VFFLKTLFYLFLSEERFVQAITVTDLTLFCNRQVTYFNLYFWLFWSWRRIWSKHKRGSFCLEHTENCSKNASN